MHRWSKLFIPTLREAPADAEVASHKFLVRAGYIRQMGAGLYNYLFLGQRSIQKIIGIVRGEMDQIAQEFFLPALLPKEPWVESGRWTGMGDNMFRLKDRKGAEMCLGMTHEEIMTTIARSELRSYKQLPQIWYQIQTKFRDEPRPKSGLLRVRQFTMKDAYSFDIDKAGLDKSFDLHDQIYRKIFSRCGLKFVAVEADSGSMGGSQSQEFMCYTDAGEDLIASCPVCGYAANTEKATSLLEPIAELEATGDGKPEEIHTPGMGAIADISAFLKMQPTNDIKCVAYMALKRGVADAKGEEKDQWLPVAAFLRGDHQVNETKLLGAIGAAELRPMVAEELEAFLHAPAGFLGPVGLKPSEKILTAELTVVVDKALEGRTNMVAGANKLDYHLRNVTPGKDFTWTLAADIRTVNEGEGCPRSFSQNKQNRQERILPSIVGISSAPGAEFETQGLTDIPAIAARLGIETRFFIKTLAYVASSPDNSIPVIIFFRGDHSPDITSIASMFSNASEFRPMVDEEIQEFFGCDPDFIGPTAILRSRNGIKGMAKAQFYADRALEGSGTMIAGANKNGSYRFTEDGDLPPVAGTFYGDFKAHEPCTGKLVVGKAVEIGHIFKLGYKYSEAMGARVLDPNGKEVTPIMGSYGIGIERILTAAVEQSNDDSGFWLSSSIAPFAVVVSITDMRDELLVATGEKLAAELDAAGIDVLLDDRKERAGVKFKDADLIGIPYRINVGKKAASGQVELVARAQNASADVAIDALLPELKARIAAESLTNATSIAE